MDLHDTRFAAFFLERSLKSQRMICSDAPTKGRPE
jgi:hypothetical protein